MKALVIIVNGLHLGYLGCYGNDWIDTPHLDRLAAEGVVFDQHYADRPDRRSCWSGRYSLPFADADDPVPVDRLGSLLESHGIARKTLRLTDVSRLSQREGFLAWLDLPSLAPPWHVSRELLDRYFGENTEEALKPWLDPPVGLLPGEAGAWRRLQDSCAAAVSQLDAQVGTLLEKLERRGLLDEMTLILTAERGLALGEHGIVGDCRPWLHEELIHLPLIVRLPSAEQAGRRVFGLTQPVDLLPTLVEAFGVPAPAEVHGHSLWPLIRGQAEMVRDYACAGLRIGDRIEWALRTPDWAFLLPVRQEVDDPPRGPRLYVKPDDRWEVNDLRQHNLELSEGLEQTLREFAAAARQPGALRAPPLRQASIQPEEST